MQSLNQGISAERGKRPVRFASRMMALSLAALPGMGFAQSVTDVHFEAGNYGTMVSGAIAGDEYADYRLGAKGGQEMFVELSLSDTDGDGSVYFNILPPGSSDVAIYNSSNDGNATTITLPEDGNYTIRVYQMGNDEDAGKTSHFNVDLSVQ